MLLRKKDKISILNLAKQTLKTPLEIWAYGSRVNGDAHDTSDLDLVVLTESKKKLDIDELINFKEALQNSNIPILIQVLDWNRIPDSFHENIFSKYEVLLKI
ncbi:MAG: nucleotidyltransferase domain-containing protein [Campylobacterota bacterium]|nr:nucleotidyltransferase domain-containing protein [Campylobacterota bacterium]